ncbi:Predicted phosphoribosyltransferase [Alkalibacterium subtropicum]|uniref:Predicted phosphoribosyltransferase n=1 Tax=Alkalibacterium subtropicum TaxID=753702 RepID=A0A1I1KDF2_9LACT|nr:phosphoribosyltransferase family protein [Alkalibacterium subtropicum]SFC59004.1 Predicted phosphoribosyltransferase [Alkalibacterium subtropicum]
MKFKNRLDAGKQLADRLDVTDAENTVVLALPRGGIPLGIEIAERHRLPFDIILSKKIGHPTHSEYAIGALSEHGDPILDETSATLLDPEWLTTELKRIRNEMARRQRTYSKALTKQPLKGKTVILVDDGIATGMTMKAAIKAVEAQEAEKIIVAVPVIPKDTYHELEKLVDEVSVVEVPDMFRGAVGAYYMSFPQVEDEEVMDMLRSFHDPSE